MYGSSIYKAMLDNVFEGIYFVDNERRITFWNKGAERITGFTADEVTGCLCLDNILNHVDSGGCQLCLNGCPLQKTIEDGVDRESEMYLHHKKGHRVSVKVRTTPIIEDGKIIGAVEIFVSAEDAFYSSYEQEELRALAFQDQLTGLANRRQLDLKLEQAFRYAQSTGSAFGVAFIDIDHFKKVNDTYGHGIGDEVLQMVAKSIQTGVKKSDLVGRWGGEEFVCLIHGIDKQGMNAVSERLRMLIESSCLRMADQELRVTASVGATIWTPKDTIKDITERADKLLYQSKQNGRNRVTID